MIVYSNYKFCIIAKLYIVLSFPIYPTTSIAIIDSKH